MYEDLVFIDSGHGVTTVWNEGEISRTLLVGRLALFAAREQQNFNRSGDEPGNVSR